MDSQKVFTPHSGFLPIGTPPPFRFIGLTRGIEGQMGAIPLTPLALEILRMNNPRAAFPEARCTLKYLSLVRFIEGPPDGRRLCFTWDQSGA
jgi:hypothetical protein